VRTFITGERGVERAPKEREGGGGGGGRRKEEEEEEEEEEGLFKANAVNREVDSERDRATLGRGGKERRRGEKKLFLLF